MKKYIFLIVFTCFILIGCSPKKNNTALNNNSTEETISVVDSIDHKVVVKKSPKNVVALSFSFAELWLLSGGKLKGVSSDAVNERDIGITNNDVQIIGTAMKPNSEKILSLNPDLVILSGDMSSNMAITGVLDNAKIPYYVCKVNTFNDYLKTLKNFVAITGEEKKYKENGEEVQEKIKNLLKLIPSSNKKVPSALVLKAYSSGVRVLKDNNVVCSILDDIGVNNIANNDESLLKDLSIEAIVKENPDYVFVVTMGKNKEAAIASLKKTLTSNPVWNNINAVKNNNTFILPKELFEYKPNNKWGDSYEYLLKIIYPEIYKTE